eukprot:CAMPEP_0170638274 /NCGR_PEP_ID=MMETSP0224-20130122/38933_1 /TAXON_ID=285029 /ORGANISM="Togula jolla, Strain CCCM 725" /LENGTH=33 /DNA_ID= /DNA_START= /DNA_END= /DNA_ORIENTATION=
MGAVALQVPWSTQDACMFSILEAEGVGGMNAAS